jgi:hypothetical protein
MAAVLPAGTVTVPPQLLQRALRPANCWAMMISLPHLHWKRMSGAVSEAG